MSTRDVDKGLWIDSRGTRRVVDSGRAVGVVGGRSLMDAGEFEFQKRIYWRLLQFFGFSTTAEHLNHVTRRTKVLDS